MRRYLYIAAAALACVVGVSVFAANFSIVSDLISTSAPGADATHTIQFKLINAIPASGRIIITPQVGKFIIPASFDYTDVDLAVSNGGPYVDRSLSSSPDATKDGVSVATGAAGSITITLNSTAGLSAGQSIQIRLGTNATFGAVGTENISNPFGITSYAIDIASKNSSGGSIDSARAMIAIVDPVTMNVKAPIVPTIRSNGQPSGLIAANNSIIELSLNTNMQAHCRYATTTDVLYDDMTANFAVASGTTHYVNTTGYQNDTTYTFYVRCQVIQSGAQNDDDFPITFTIKPTPISNTSVESEGFITSGPTGNLGPGGAGDFPNGSAVLFLSTVTFSGYSVPNSLITILKDGVKAGSVQTKDDGTFVTTVTGIERGAYGFQLYAQDNHSLTSSLYSTTLSVAQGTDNDVTSIVIPPTIEISKDAISTGDPVTVSGAAPPSVPVQVTVAGQTGSAATEPIRIITATSTSRGDWSVTLDTAQYAKGTFAVQARVTQSDKLKSGLSKSLILTVGLQRVAAVESLI
jgi:hypothetical protein